MRVGAAWRGRTKLSRSARARDDVDVDLLALAHELVEKRRPEHVAPARMRRLSDDDLRDVARSRVAHRLVRRVVRAERDRLARRATRRAACAARAARDLPSRDESTTASRRRAAIELGVEARRHAPRRADQAAPSAARRDAHEDALARVPRSLDAVRGLVPAHLRVDALGRPAQGELAQRDEVSLLEEVLDRARAPARARRPCPRAGARAARRTGDRRARTS